MAVMPLFRGSVVSSGRQDGEWMSHAQRPLSSLLQRAAASMGLLLET